MSAVIVNIEVLEITFDGLTGSHRAFAHILSGILSLRDQSDQRVLSAGALIATIIFLFRRNVVKVRRFTSPENERLAVPGCQPRSTISNWFW